MSATHRTVPTPDPSQRSLVVTVSEDSFASVGGVIPKEGTLYKDPAFKTYFGKDYQKNFSDFAYTGQVGDYGLAFARGSFNADKQLIATPKPFRSSWRKFGNHRWCPLLEGLAFIEDTEFPQATNVIINGDQGLATAPKYYVHEAYVAEVNEGSRFFLDEFFSPVPYVLARSPVPQPGRVSYQINGLRGAFEECLHDDIEIPATNGATATLIDGSQTNLDSKILGQFFPRTNFRRRRPYILTSDQVYQDGGWYMQRLRVFPPRQPKTTISA